MISLCTVMLDGMEKFLETMIDSLLKRTKLIKEVIIVKVDDEDPTEKKWEQRGVVFRKFGHYLDENMLHGHPLGLHQCIERATNEYLLFSDPDIFFCTSVDEFYMDLIKKYELNVIGTSHHAAINQSYTFFPCVMNMIVRKDELPDNQFLKGHLRLRPTILRAIPPNEEPNAEKFPLLDGKYLTIGPIPEFIDEFPNKNPRCHFDVGCNLWLWAKEKNWKWLSFQTMDCHYYWKPHFRSNVKIPKITSKEKLLYHCTASGLTGRDEGRFLNEYRKFEQEESELNDD